jgi:hypothetical protein
MYKYILNQPPLTYVQVHPQSASTELRGVAQNKPDRRNTEKIVHFQKTFISDYFFKKPTPIQPNFFLRSFRRRIAATESSLAMVLSTPSLVFLKVSCIIEMAVSSAFTLGNRKWTTDSICGK